MANEVVDSVKGTIKLDDGTTATGAKRTVNVSLGKLKASAWDPDKALAIVDKLENVFDKAVYRVMKVTEARVTE